MIQATPPRLRRAYYDCRYGQLHVHNAIPAGGEHVEREMALLRLVVKAGADAALLDCLQTAGARAVHSNGPLLLVEMTGGEADINSLLAAVADHASLDAVARSGPLGLPHYGSKPAG